MTTFRPDVTLNDANLIDIDAYAKVNNGYKETLRRLKRAERRGDVIHVATPTGGLWYWARK